MARIPSLYCNMLTKNGINTNMNTEIKTYYYYYYILTFYILMNYYFTLYILILTVMFGQFTSDARRTHDEHFIYII